MEERRPGREFDFHASVSLLGHHPELLRHLGLAVDLEVDLCRHADAETGCASRRISAAIDKREVGLETRTTAGVPGPAQPER